MLEIKDLCFSYNNLTPYILDNINLNIKKGEYISILGDNGSGKSTLLKLMLGFLTPLNGSLKINSNKIGYVPQVFENFNSDFPITIYEMLNCHRKALKIKNKDAVDKSLSLVKMKCFKNDLIGNLSGGQRQKIFITRSLMGNPDILILDEPSTGIDIKSQKEIYTLIKELNIKKNITVISVEHNLKAALDNSSRIFLLNSGKGQCYSKEDFYKFKEAFI